MRELFSKDSLEGKNLKLIFDYCSMLSKEIDWVQEDYHYSIRWHKCTYHEFSFEGSSYEIGLDVDGLYFRDKSLSDGWDTNYERSVQIIILKYWQNIKPELEKIKNELIEQGNMLRKKYELEILNKEKEKETWLKQMKEFKL